MSLLLDALRRAGSARDASGEARPSTLASEDSVTHAEAPAASPDANAHGRARAEAVFRGGRGGHPRLRAAGIVSLSVVLLGAAGVVGAWYYYESSVASVDRSLSGYAPTAEVASTSQSSSEPAPAASEGEGGSRPAEATPSGAEPNTQANAATDGATEPRPGDGESAGGVAETAPAEAETAADADEPVATAASGDIAGAQGDGGTAAAPATSGRNRDEKDTQRAAAASSERRDPAASAARPADDGEAPLVRASRRPAPLLAALQAGYQALRAGDVPAAERHYARALELAPSNRDAHLGAAAVARRQGDDAAAVRHYRSVLADHPRDPYARAGLSDLDASRDPRRSESELKTLIKQDPDAHALRFALGNLYAREQRWSRAQAAYFEAFRAAPEQADYAFNLAVALDHLGQREAARTYYRTAIEQVGDGAASFPLDAARRRLEALSP